MARTKDAVLAPEQKELMEKEYLDFVKPSTYGNKDNQSSCNSLYDDVENPELRAIVEKVAATTPYRSAEAHQWQAAQGDIGGVSADLPPSSKD